MCLYDILVGSFYANSVFSSRTLHEYNLIPTPQTWVAEENTRRQAAGLDVGLMAQLGIVKDMSTRMRNELALESKKLDKKFGITSGSGDKVEDDLLADDSTVPVIRPGDASVAAPFTSRMPSVRSVVELIRQGRCTLLSALQQQQIMMLECTISAYTYAAISLEGARSSERQMMASSWLILTASVAFSFSTPIETMHPVRPLKSLFHPAIFLSILGQAVIHLTAMSIAVTMAKQAMGEDLLKEVAAFNRKVLNGDDVEQDEDDPLAAFNAMWSKPYKPNLMNTTVFLVETVQIMSVLFVNYKGRPWMKGITENHALFLSLFMCVFGCGGKLRDYPRLFICLLCMSSLLYLKNCIISRIFISMSIIPYL